MRAYLATIGVVAGGNPTDPIGVPIQVAYDTSSGQVYLPQPSGSPTKVLVTVPPLTNDELASAGFESYAPAGPSAAGGFPGWIAGIQAFFDQMLSGNSLSSAFAKLGAGGTSSVGLGSGILAPNQGEGGGGGGAGGGSQASAAANPNINNPANPPPTTPTIPQQINLPAAPASQGGGGGGFNLGAAAQATGGAVAGALGAVGGAVAGGAQSAYSAVSGAVSGAINTVSNALGKIGL